MFVLFFLSKNIIDYTEAKKRQSIGLVPHMVEDIRKYSNCADEHVQYGHRKNKEKLLFYI